MSHHLGPYKIIEQVGNGAMGEVYLAEDTRLGRRVAIKVLPAEFARQPERLRRFEREAQAAAALNHPNIATVYDVGFEGLAGGAGSAAGVGSSGHRTAGDGVGGHRAAKAGTLAAQTDHESAQDLGLHFIVQEYLQGETLRRRLERRPPALGRALCFATEIAGALAAAHEAGIVHRDLKPENIFVTEQESVKVLDFGLAKLMHDDEDGAEPLRLGAAAPDSIVGRIIGTPGYMAPEQVNGESSDRRADIFSFGAMLYELVAGRKAFEGRSAAECLSRVVHDEPVPLDEADPSLPLELCRIVHKCVQKDPSRRYQGAADLEVDLRALLAAVERGTAAPAGAVAAAATERRDARWGTLGLPAVAITAVLAALITWAAMPPAAPSAPPVLRFSVSLPEGIEITSTERPVVAMSRDGGKVVVAANGALWLRELAGEQFDPLAGSEPRSRGSYAVAPDFAPDGAHVAFFLDGAIRRVPVAGGAPITLAEAIMPSSIHWGTDGYVYYSQAAGDGVEQTLGSEGIWRVPEQGGAPEPVIALDGDRRAAAPQLLPGNEWLLYSTTSASGFVTDAASREEIVVESLRTGERRTLLTEGFAGRYIDTGHILYVESTSLWAVPFNLDGLEVTGGATQVIESVPVSSWAGSPYLGVADAGNLVIPELALLPQRNGRVSWVGSDGEIAPLDVPLADNPRLDRPGTRVAVEVRDVGETRIWVHEIDRDGWTELTPGSPAAAPVWSADGRWLYFMATDDDGTAAVWRKSTDFTGPAEALWRPVGHVPYPESTADDGSFLLYSAALGDQNDIWLLWLDGDGGAVPLTGTPHISEEGAQIHPSGRWVAYTGREADRSEVYVQELGDGAQLTRRYKISEGGGAEPMWSRDGRTLYYRVGAHMIAVDVDIDPDFHPGDSRVLMRDFPGDVPTLRADYDVTPDGRFITSLPQGVWSAQRLDVVINWFTASGLRRSDPTATPTRGGRRPGRF